MDQMLEQIKTFQKALSDKEAEYEKRFAAMQE